MDAEMTSLLEQELEPLNRQIGELRASLGALEGELRVVEAELETFSADQQRFDALRTVCAALDRLGELEAAELFWGDLPATTDSAAHLQRLQGRVAQFEEEIRGVLERQKGLKAQIEARLDDLDYLYDEVLQAHAREERRQEEFVVEREISPLPYRRMLMPWSKEDESERYYRRSVVVALLLSLTLGYLIPLVMVPERDRMVAVEIPERLAMLVKKEPPKPEPVRERPKEEVKPEADPDKPQEIQPKEAPKVAAPEAKEARTKAEAAGVLAFKETFADLMEETPIAKLGAEARLNNQTQVAGQARAQRSLVAMQAKGGVSGGISNAGVSRN
ncbi:MAG: hypothetical protein IH614_15125, partial [Desulfuromonadales bacterium]|nr:hypothetical protein [Desulfuromonadales bacterium]